MAELYGHTSKLKASEIKRLQNTYRRKTGEHEVVSVELARHLTELSAEIGRQVAVLINRKGETEYVVVGTPVAIDLPDLGRFRAGAQRFRGLRLVHTHLKQEPLTDDDLTDLALLRLDLVAAVGVKPDGSPGRTFVAHLVPENPEHRVYERLEANDPWSLKFDFAASIAAVEAEFSRAAGITRAGKQDNRVILVGVRTREGGSDEASLAELAELARTAGCTVVDTVLQRRAQIDPKYVVGKGKLKDLILLSMQRCVDVLIFDIDLSPKQARVIAEETDVEVIDRTQLILRIFGQHAKGSEGKVQVELAQLRYELPRLSEKQTGLSRITGGIGGQGPGETKLEIHRRRLKDRMHALERSIETIGKRRALRKRSRGAGGLPAIAIVGYTNTGKSTLLNALTDSDVLAEDKLFATLEPTSRRLRFPKERDVIITDTVGFIRKLPPDLMRAFRATLEDVKDADLLLHVVDISNPHFEEQMANVDGVLAELGVEATARIVVFNKIDAADPDRVREACMKHHGVAISALQRRGLHGLLNAVYRCLWNEGMDMETHVTVMSEPVAQEPLAV